MPRETRVKRQELAESCAGRSKEMRGRGEGRRGRGGGEKSTLNQIQELALKHLLFADLTCESPRPKNIGKYSYQVDAK